MSNDVITNKNEWMNGLFSELDRIAKDAATIAFCRTANWEGKSSIGKTILSKY